MFAKAAKPYLTSTTDPLSEPVEVSSLGPLIAEYSSRISTEFDFYLAAGAALETPSHISSLLFHSAFHQHTGKGYTFHYPSNPARHLTVGVPMQKFLTPVSASPDLVTLGGSGRRAVWRERRWDTDEYRFMKGAFLPIGESPLVEELLPRHLALPFDPQTCQSLAFDEATGRVCLGFHTGELYILDLWVA